MEVGLIRLVRRALARCRPPVFNVPLLGLEPFEPAPGQEKERGKPDDCDYIDYNQNNKIASDEVGSNITATLLIGGAMMGRG